MNYRFREFEGFGGREVGAGFGDSLYICSHSTALGSPYFMSRLQKSEEGWTDHEILSIEDLNVFREVLFNKYQRRRIPWEDVLTIDKMIEEA